MNRQSLCLIGLFRGRGCHNAERQRHGKCKYGKTNTDMLVPNACHNRWLKAVDLECSGSRATVNGSS